MQAQGGRGCIDPTYSRPRPYGGMWSASRPDRALPPGKGRPVPILQEAEWAPEPASMQRLEENPLASARDRISIGRLSNL
jgi:hypothetical protein